MVRSLQPILRRSSRPPMKWLAVRAGGKVAAQQPFDIVRQLGGRDLHSLHFTTEGAALPQVATEVDLVGIDPRPIGGGGERPHESDVRHLEAGAGIGAAVEV